MVLGLPFYHPGTSTGPYIALGLSTIRGPLRGPPMVLDLPYHPGTPPGPAHGAGPFYQPGTPPGPGAGNGIAIRHAPPSLATETLGKNVKPLVAPPPLS